MKFLACSQNQMEQNLSFPTRALERSPPPHLGSQFPTQSSMGPAPLLGELASIDKLLSPAFDDFPQIPQLTLDLKSSCV